MDAGPMTGEILPGAIFNSFLEKVDIRFSQRTGWL